MQHFVAVRDYSRLKDMAEASAVAGQVRGLQFSWQVLLLPPPSDPARSWLQAAHIYRTAHMEYRTVHRVMQVFCELGEGCS